VIRDTNRLERHAARFMARSGSSTSRSHIHRLSSATGSLILRGINIAASFLFFLFKASWGCNSCCRLEVDHGWKLRAGGGLLQYSSHSLTLILFIRSRIEYADRPDRQEFEIILAMNVDATRFDVLKDTRGYIRYIQY
jgi:hypothetical protein